MKKKVFCLLGVLMFNCGHVFPAGKTGFAFLNSFSFARTAAMADARTAMVGDISMISANPAGMAHIKSNVISVQHMSHFQDMVFDHMAFVRPSLRGAWGIHVGVHSVKGITKTQYDSSAADRFIKTGQLKAGSQFVALSYGYRERRSLALGGTAKLIKEDLDGESAMTVAIDCGAIYRVNHFWRVAGVVQNAGPAAKFIDEKFYPPARAKIGIFNAPERWMEWEMGCVYNLYGDPELLIGGELNWAQTGFVRSGYKYFLKKNDLGSLEGLTFGLGFVWHPMALDYAYLPFGDMGQSHKISFTWRFK